MWVYKCVLEWRNIFFFLEQTSSMDLYGCKEAKAFHIKTDHNIYV